jgi:hypothetical protein
MDFRHPGLDPIGANFSASEPSPACGRGLGEGLLPFSSSWKFIRNSGWKKKKDPHPTFSRKREKAKNAKVSAYGIKSGMTKYLRQALSPLE